MTTPSLPDERVDAMRDAVLGRVDADVRRRGRRARALAGVAAVGLVVALGGVGYQSLVGLAENGDESAASSGAGDSAGEVAPGVEPGVRGDVETAPQDVARPQERAVVVTGHVEVRADDPRGAASAVTRWVEDRGGRIDRRTESGAGEDASATLEVRVPGDDVQALVDRLGTVGTVLSVDVEKADVETQRRDLDARVRSLQVSVQRLEDILAEADSAADLVRTEAELSRRQAELEGLQAQRGALRDQVALASVTVALLQAEDAAGVEPGGFLGGVRSGWNALVAVVNGSVELVGVAVPWLGLALLGWLAWRVGRRAVRR